MDQPFDVHLMLDLSEVVAPDDTQFSYKVPIFGKSLEGHPRQVVGEATGIINFTDRVTINVKGTTLPRGIYRLQAAAALQPTTIRPMPNTGLTAAMEGDLLLII